MVQSNGLAIFALVAVGAAIIVDIHRDVRRVMSARNVGLLTIVGWFLFEAIMLPDEVVSFQQQQYNMAICYVLLSAASGLAVYHSVRGGVFDDFSARLFRADHPRLLWTIFLVGLAIGLLPLLFAANFDVMYIIASAFHYGKRWSDRFARARYGGLGDAFMEVQMFLKAIVPVAVVLIADKRTSAGRKLFCIGFLVWMVSRSAVGGTRSTLLLVVLPVLAAVYWRLKPSTQKLGILVGVPIAAVIATQWSAAVVSTRESGKFHWEGAQDVDYVGLEMFRELLYLSVNVPEKLPYRFGHTYYVQLVNPVPRFLWPGKPIADAGLLMALARGEVDENGEPYLTRSPGLIGEMYWNFGIPGIIIMSGLCGYFLKSWDRAVFHMRHSMLTFVVFAAGLATIFLSGRSITMNVYYGMLSFYGLLVLLDRKAAPVTVSQPRRAYSEVART